MAGKKGTKRTEKPTQDSDTPTTPENPSELEEEKEEESRIEALVRMAHDEINLSEKEAQEQLTKACDERKKDYQNCKKSFEYAASCLEEASKIHPPYGKLFLRVIAGLILATACGAVVEGLIGMTTQDTPKEETPVETTQLANPKIQSMPSTPVLFKGPR